MLRRFALPALLIAGVVGGAAAWGQAQEAQAIAAARKEAEEALRRSDRLEKQAAAATSEAAKARAEAAALAARIEAAEADITAAEARLRVIGALRAQQRARLAERQQPVVRLAAALQTMARRPAALALVQPGSLHEVVHVRSLLASTLPVIRARTANLRAEVEAGNRLQRQADAAVKALVGSRETLRQRRTALARFEESRRARSASLLGSAMFEEDRALVFDERARELSEQMNSRSYRELIQRRLAELPNPVLRPGTKDEAAEAAYYRLPVEGRVVTGMGEISDAGVHARGLTLETRSYASVIAPRAGSVAYAGPYRSYDSILIIDHGKGWTTLVTGLGSLAVKAGDRIDAGALLGRASGGTPRVTVELRQNNRPVPITPLLGAA